VSVFGEEGHVGRCGGAAGDPSGGEEEEAVGEAVGRSDVAV